MIRMGLVHQAVEVKKAYVNGFKSMTCSYYFKTSSTLLYKSKTGARNASCIALS
jgi:hypothetical protein